MLPSNALYLSRQERLARREAIRGRLADRAKRLRTIQGMSMWEVAALAGTSPETIRHIEDASHDAGASVVTLVAQALGATAGALLDEEDGQEEALAALWRDLTPNRKEEALAYIRYLRVLSFQDLRLARP